MMDSPWLALLSRCFCHFHDMLFETRKCLRQALVGAILSVDAIALGR
jgi:hypothetical protein